MSQADTSKNFYVLSMGKLTVLYFCTMGLFLYYWFFRQWRTMEQQTGRRLFPAMRTVLAVFFIFELLNFIRSEQRKASDERRWHPRRLALIFIGGNLFYLISYMLVSETGGPWQWSLFVLLLTHLLNFYVIYESQLIVNRLGNDPYGDVNRRLSLQNQMWMILGAYLWANLFYGFYLEATGQRIPQRGEQPVRPPAVTAPAV